MRMRLHLVAIFVTALVSGGCRSRCCPPAGDAVGRSLVGPAAAAAPTPPATASDDHADDAPAELAKTYPGRHTQGGSLASAGAGIGPLTFGPSFLSSAPFRDPTAISPADDQTMVVHCVYIGQGDATVLEFAHGLVLIDSGAQYETVDSADPTTSLLVRYLDKLFDSRPHLHRTIDAVFVTHDHRDHHDALSAVLRRYEVKHYIDNGPRLDSHGREKSLYGAYEDARTIAAQKGFSVRSVRSREVTTASGVSGDDIDPLDDPSGDPKVAVLSGRFADDEVRSWDTEAWENENNHSLVVRVQWGRFSALFSGDLETEAIEYLLDWYGDGAGGTLDVDLYHVGHHGSRNATTSAYLQAMTPRVAVCSMSQPGYRGERSGWGYGHPRKAVVEMVEAAVDSQNGPTDVRPSPMTVKVAKGARNFEPYTVRQHVYGTGWEGTVAIRVRKDGTFAVVAP